MAPPMQKTMPKSWSLGDALRKDLQKYINRSPACYSWINFSARPRVECRRIRPIFLRCLAGGDQLFYIWFLRACRRQPTCGLFFGARCLLLTYV